MPATPDPGHVAEARDRRQRAELVARRGRRPRARPGARTPPRPPRRAGARPRATRRPGASRPSSSIRPSVTVPVLSRTTVVIRRVRSRTSGPRMRIPSCAPRPVPTMSAVGVARPSAHGHAMIRTATAAANAAVAPPPSERASPRASRAASARTTGTKTAETRSARRWIGALPDWASATSRAICASAVSSPTLVARTRSRPNVLIVAPATLAARPDVDGHRLAGQHRLVDRRLALDDDAVGRDLLAGTHDEHVADDELARPAPRPPCRRAERAPPSPRARAARGSPRPSGAARGPRGSGRGGSAS